MSGICVDLSLILEICAALLGLLQAPGCTIHRLVPSIARVMYLIVEILVALPTLANPLGDAAILGRTMNVYYVNRIRNWIACMEVGSWIRPYMRTTRIPSAGLPRL